MKKMLSLILSIVMITMTATMAFAENAQIDSSVEALQNLPLEEKLDRLEWHEYTDLENIAKEDTYSYDELISYLKDNGFTEEEVLNFAGERPIETRSSSIRYTQIKMTKYQHKSNYYVQFRVSAGLEYLSGATSPSRIVSLDAGHVSTEGGKNCIFAGDIFYTLAAGNYFYYNYYGRLFQSGNLNWTLGGEVGIGETASVSLSISNSNGDLGPVDHAEPYTSSGLDP